MATSGSKPRHAKQGVSYANIAGGTPANKMAALMEASIPGITTNTLTELQATLQKAMQEMSQVSGILKDLQSDVS